MRQPRNPVACCPNGLVSLRRFLVPLALLATWQIVAESGLFRPVFMPSLQAIAGRSFELLRSGLLFEAAGISLVRLFAGFLGAVLCGIVIGLLVTRLRFAEQMAVRLLSALLATPAVAWTPLFMLWFGLGTPATVALIVFVAAVPIAMNTWSGIVAAEPILLRVAKSMHVSGLERFFKVLLPAALPAILAGLRLGFGRAWHALVAGELIAGVSSGLGVLITRGRVFLDTPSLIVGVLGIAILAYLTERIFFERLERRMLQTRGFDQ